MTPHHGVDELPPSTTHRAFARAQACGDLDRAAADFEEAGHVAPELRVSVPAILSVDSAEVRFSFENKQGVTVTLADTVSVQHNNLITAIVRRVATESESESESGGLLAVVC